MIMMSMAMRNHNQTALSFWALVILVVGIALVSCGTTPLKKRSLVMIEGGSGEPEEPESSIDQIQKLKSLSKKTFCNAFTGCGRKRSDGSIPPSKDYEYDQESGPGGEQTSDDMVVDDIARDILAEARLWEALQARNSIRTPFKKQAGFFPRQKRETHYEKRMKNYDERD